MNVIKNLIKRSSNLHSLFGNVIYAAFSMVLFILMIRLLDKELYGRWVIFMTAISLLDMLRLGLTGTGAIRAISVTTGINQFQNISASYYLSIFTTLSISLVFVPIYFAINGYFTDSYYLPVLLYYPFLAFANLAHMQASNYSQGIVNFKRVLVIRSLVGFFNLLFIGLYIYFYDETLQGVIIAYGVSDILVSLYVILKKWDGLMYLKYYHKTSILNILKFGKYSAASSIGSSLLRSSDTIIISLSSVMGAPAVAIFAIPLKFLELIEIPLRSFSATAFPKLSAAYIEGKEPFKKTLNMYVSYSVLMLIPIIIFTPLFSEQVLMFFGGMRYADSLELQKNLLYIITFYIITLPYDRFGGMALFAFDKPKLNFYKITLMLLLNVIFDLIAVFVFHSLELVALASVLFTIFGIIYGWNYIYKQIGLTILESFIDVFQTGKYVSRLGFKLLNQTFKR